MNLKNLSVQNKKHKKILSQLNSKKISKIYNEFSSSLEVKENLAVAVSGGPDSLALAYLTKCYSLKNKIKVKYYIDQHRKKYSPPKTSHCKINTNYSYNNKWNQMSKF